MAKCLADSSFWVNENGENPKPFEVISIEDVKKSVWKVVNQNLESTVHKYIESLNKVRRDLSGTRFCKDCFLYVEKVCEKGNVPEFTARKNTCDSWSNKRN